MCFYVLTSKRARALQWEKKFIISNGHDHISLHHRDTISLSISRNHEYFEIMNNLLNSCTYLKSQTTYYYKFLNIFYNQEHFFNLWIFFAIYKHFLEIVNIFKQFSWTGKHSIIDEPFLEIGWNSYWIWRTFFDLTNIFGNARALQREKNYHVIHVW